MCYTADENETRVWRVEQAAASHNQTEFDAKTRRAVRQGNAFRALQVSWPPTRREALNVGARCRHAAGPANLLTLISDTDTNTHVCKKTRTDHPEEGQAPWIVFENVPETRKHDDGNTWRTCLRIVADAGYHLSLIHI